MIAGYINRQIHQSKAILLVFKAFIKNHLEYSIWPWQTQECVARQCITDENLVCQRYSLSIRLLVLLRLSLSQSLSTQTLARYFCSHCSYNAAAEPQSWMVKIILLNRNLHLFMAGLFLHWQYSLDYITLLSYCCLLPRQTYRGQSYPFLAFPFLCKTC